MQSNECIAEGIALIQLGFFAIVSIDHQGLAVFVWDALQ